MWVETADDDGGVRMRFPDLLPEEVLELHVGFHLDLQTKPGRFPAALIEGRYLSVEGDSARPTEKRFHLQVDVERVCAPEEQRERRLKRIELLELDVKDLEKASEFGDYIVEKARPSRFDQKSPLPGDDTHFGTIDLQVRNYHVGKTEKYRFHQYLLVVGVVARAQHGWLFIKEGEPLREATRDDVEILPHLPDDWEAFVINVTESV